MRVQNFFLFLCICVGFSACFDGTEPEPAIKVRIVVDTKVKDRLDVLVKTFRKALQDNGITVVDDPSVVTLYVCMGGHGISRFMQENQYDSDLLKKVQKESREEVTSLLIRTGLSPEEHEQKIANRLMLLRVRHEWLADDAGIARNVEVQGFSYPLHIAFLRVRKLIPDSVDDLKNDDIQRIKKYLLMNQWN